MKKFHFFKQVFFLIFFLVSLNGYSQQQEKKGILGTVTFDEKGNVTVKPFAGKNNTANISAQTSNLPQKFNVMPEDSKPTGNVQTSSGKPVNDNVILPTISDNSKPAITSVKPLKAESIQKRNTNNTFTFSSNKAELLLSDDPGNSGQLKSAEGQFITSNDVKSGGGLNIQRIYESNRQKPLTSAQCEQLAVDEVTLVRWYGEKDYIVTPTTKNPNEYQQRITNLSKRQGNGNGLKSHIVNLNLTDNIKDKLKAIDIIIPEFMTEQVNICIPECDLSFLDEQQINYTTNDKYGISTLPVEFPGLKSAGAVTSTIWSEGFEGTFPGTSFNVGDSNALNGVDTWDDVNCDKHSGSYSIWCAANGDQSDCVNYDDNMSSWVKNISAINVSGYTDVHFNFYSKYITEATNDLFKYWASANGTSWSLIASYSGNAGGWVYRSFLLTGYTSFFWEFDFISNSSAHSYIGAYVDDLSVTGTALAPNLALQSGSANCTVSGTTVNLSFTVVNNGNTSAGASTVGYYLSPDINITTTPNYTIGTDAVGTLAVGGTSAETHSVNVAAMSIPCGTYYVFFCMDDLNQIAESNENDNDWYFPSPTVTIPCVPNLDLASGSSSISVTGTNVTISVTAINNGSTTAGASTLGYYLSPDASITTTPNYLIGTDAIPSLAIGGTSAESLTVDVSTKSIPCGTYYVFFYFDYLGVVSESNESDNIWYFSSPTVTIPCLPNLDLSSGTASLTVSGTTVSVSLTVTNNGEAASIASELGYYLSSDVTLTTTPNYLIGTDPLSALATGGTSAETIAVDVSQKSVPCGTYYVIFKIDNLDQVTESNENDNIFYWSTPTVVIPCVPNLDLASGTATLSVTGTSISLSATVINNGSATAAESKVGYYLSPDASITTTPNYLIGTDAVSSLGIGGTSAESIIVDVSTSSVPCGTYYVFFYFDYLNQVTESNETDNNWYFSSPQVTIPCVPNIDLASGTSSLSVTGISISISVTAINNGSTTAGASVLGYYLSSDASYSTTPNYLIGSDAVPSLAVGGKSAQSITVDVLTITPLIPCGTYYVFFVFDHLNQITEVNETDNIWYFSSPTVSVPSQPNLTYKSGTGSITVSGTTVNLSYTVINSGNCGSGICSSGYYLSPDISITTAPNYLIGTTSIPALDAGGINAQTFSKDVLTVSPAIPCGTYYVFFYPDYLGQVEESNENDNAWYFTSPQVTISSNCCTALAVTPSNQSVTTLAGSTSYSLTTTGGRCSWTAVSNQAWCTLSPTSGTGNATITATYTGYTTCNNRVATITVTVPGLSPVSVTLTQNGCAIPAAPVATAASGITQTGFNANWNSSSGATGYYLDVSTSNVFASFVAGYNNKDVGNILTSYVTGLTAGTTYYYRVRAYNPGGASPNSNVITVSTIPAAPVASSASVITQTGFDANWAKSSGAAGYYLDVSTSNVFASFVTGYNNKDVGPVLTSSVTGLTAGTTYYYRLRAYNTGGTSPNSNVITVSTIPAAPVASSASVITQTGFDANWAKSSGAAGYYLDVSTSNVFASFVTGYNNKDVGPVLTSAVSGLTAGTTYYYRLRAYNIGGTSSNSNVITVSTIPAAPVATAATIITNNSFYANWNASTGATGYFLDVATDNLFTSFLTGYDNRNVGNVVTESINGLTAGTSYYYRLRAFNSGGTSENSNITEVITSDLCARHFHPVWEGTAGFNHMNINVIEAKHEGLDLQAGDEIGVFDGSLCVGYGKVTETIDHDHALSITVSQNDGSGNGYTPGHEVLYIFWDCSSETEFNVQHIQCFNNELTPVICSAFSPGVTTFVSLSDLAFETQLVSLNVGWNIMSLRVLPEVSNLKEMLQSLIDEGKLKKVMDEKGSVIEDWGVFGGWKNYIGDLQLTEGYKINVTSPALLEVEGVPVRLPFEIALYAGWNIISWPSPDQQDGIGVFNALIAAGKLKKVMDESGKTIEDWGIFGGWKNNIGKLQPGEGYNVNVNSDCILVINESGTKSEVVLANPVASTHFVLVYKGNGTDHMNINLVNLAESGIKTGDEIGVFDGNICVGAVKIPDQFLSDVSIPVSANDGLEGKNGFTPGNNIEMKVYRNGSKYPLILQPLSENGTLFKKGSSLFAKVDLATGVDDLFNTEFTEINVYPNPFSEQITIGIVLASKQKVEVDVYDIKGALVKSLFENEAEGKLNVYWDGRNQAGAKMISGTYFIKINDLTFKVILE